MRPRQPEGVWARVDRLKRQRAERDTREFPIEVEVYFQLAHRAHEMLHAAGVPIAPITLPNVFAVRRGKLAYQLNDAGTHFKFRWEPTP